MKRRCGSGTERRMLGEMEAEQRVLSVVDAMPIISSTFAVRGWRYLQLSRVSDPNSWRRLHKAAESSNPRPGQVSRRPVALSRDRLGPSSMFSVLLPSPPASSSSIVVSRLGPLSKTSLSPRSGRTANLPCRINYSVIGCKIGPESPTQWQPSSRAPASFAPAP